ncbi:hypothetical protein I3843_12G098200 [Carya illinoinensis]|uniref:Uncharacterized protein n=1 Tax=Carya illinoinensis TaxID=32201 RepID=A0A922DIM9_CARIL|nr:hypothetical protein I3842_12G097600 [Carya illinoinensis]KAG7953199.1 hypothetical protein I3843_12G098200 [Carya illinoinensis]
MKIEDQTRSLFGISLSDRPIWQKFLVCSSGFFFGYLVNGICETSIYPLCQLPSFLVSSYGWYFTFVQGFVYPILIYLQGFTTKKMVNPWRTCVKLSGCSYGFSWINKGIMFKSTKVKVKESVVSSFTLSDAHTSPNFSVIGVGMIIGAIIMEAFLGNLQEAIFTMNPNTTQTQMLFCSTVVGLPFLVLPMILTGELHPYVYGVLVCKAMATFIGATATTAMVTTARKAVTLLSYLIFTKPITEQHGTGLLLIAMGIVLNMLPDYKLTDQSETKSTVVKQRKHSFKVDNSLLENEGSVEKEKRPLV